MNSIQKFGEFLGPHIKFVEHLHKFHLRTCLQHQAACDPPCASLPQICWHMGNFFFSIASGSCKTSMQFVYQEICISLCVSLSWEFCWERTYWSCQVLTYGDFDRFAPYPFLLHQPNYKLLTKS